MDFQIDRLLDKQIDIETDRLIDKQIHIEIHRQIDKLQDKQIQLNYTKPITSSLVY